MLTDYNPKRGGSREDRVDPMWLTDSEDDRLLAIYRRAAERARKALAGKDAH